MDEPSRPSRILELAGTIQLAVSNVHDILTSRKASLPSFEEDCPPLPTDLNDSRNAILDATAELQDLFTEPLSLIHRSSRSDKSACLQVIARFQIAKLVPVGGSATFGDIARQTPLTEQMVGRIIRHAATMRIFREMKLGIVMHTRASRLLAGQAMIDWIRAGTEELGPAGGKLAEALEKWPGSQEPNETGFSLANGTSGSVYEVIAQNPDRAVRFANAMEVMTSRPEFDLSFGIDYYDWESLGAAQVVDVGGAKGHFAIALANRFPQLRITVQDMTAVVSDADAGAVTDRIPFVPHDLFADQTIVADVYFFRWIFHNWSDKYCIKILRAQVRVLKPGARIVVQEAIMPRRGTVAEWKEQDLRSMDLEMAYTFNGRERTLIEWQDLFAVAHPSFVLKSIVEPEGSAMGIMEFVWQNTERQQRKDH